MNMRGVHIDFIQEEGVLLQKYADGNRSCIAILSPKVPGSGVDVTLLRLRRK